MFRRLLVVLSLLVCTATVVISARSYRREDHLSWLADGERHTLCSSHGKIALFVPPAGIGPRTAQDALVRPILDAQVDWVIRCVERGRFGVAEGGYLTPSGYGEHTGVASPPLIQLAAPLLRALENPDAALNAHVALALRDGRPGGFTIQPQPVRVGGKNIASYDGAQVILFPRHSFMPHALFTMYTSTAQIDVACLPTVRDQWHRRLDVARWSFGYGWIAALAGVAPVALFLRSMAVASRTRIRRHRGQCISCGYDLRASSECCPECGQVVRPRATS